MIAVVGIALLVFLGVLMTVLGVVTGEVAFIVTGLALLVVWAAILDSLRGES